MDFFVDHTLAVACSELEPPGILAEAKGNGGEIERCSAGLPSLSSRYPESEEEEP
jgi:hypothetical protein